MNSSIRMDEYCDEAYIHLGIYVNKLLSAWTEVWIDTWPSRERFWLPGVVLGRFSRLLEIVGGAGVIKNSISMYNYMYCDEPYIHLGIYGNKLLSAWTEVWIGTSTWPSMERVWSTGHTIRGKEQANIVL